ncbi:sigma-70 family RNA polymerase sigma factor [Candidatus Poribacteria bacterium]|nr:sigma-70 family RNA polymerase sigma factor [Candidatus Poribacteria bacterium]MYB65613.1 sigma-70 family RNA polymerase sigma factor [Candidatus Poribacteria bacterium]MYF57098.1 sigma-70 family RNA polymerase sigma factor [Candidatus Poribacteria bacterium]
MQSQSQENIPLSDNDDAELIEQFQNGNTAVFDTLFTRYQKRTYRLVQRFVPNHEDALDITQDAFIRAYQGLSNFKSQCQFYSWLYRITVNLCIDFLRKKSRSEVMVYESEDSDELPMANFPDLRSVSPAKAAENKELRSQIRKAIRQLPPKQRQIFILRHWDGLSLKDIATVVGRSDGTVKAHLFHAHRNLRKHLQPYLKEADL